MHALFSTHKEAILPFFDQLLPLFVKLLVGGAVHGTCNSIHFIDDAPISSGNARSSYQQKPERQINTFVDKSE